MSNDIRIGQQVVWQETNYLIKAIKPELGDLVLEAKGGFERSVDINEFYNLIAAGDLFLPNHKIEVVERAITASEQAEADFRQELVELMDKLEELGVTEASVACTHGLFAGKAVERLRGHPAISEVVTTDTVPAPADWPELKIRSVAPLFAEAIARIHAGESVSSLFDGVDPTHAPPQPKLPL